MRDPLTPKLPLAPALPLPGRATAALAADGGAPPPAGGVSEEDGGRSIPDRARFDALSHRDDVPGAAGVPEVKFLILGIDGEDPQLYFINSTRYPYHFYFARDVLRLGLGVGEFNRLTYFSDNRRHIAGTVLAHDAFTGAGRPDGVFAVEFWPTDPVSAPLAIKAWTLIAAAMPFARGRIDYHPSGARQEEICKEAAAAFEASGVPVILSEVLFAGMRYSALNLGIGYGRLRVIEPSDPHPPGLTDIVVFRALPNDLTHVGGVLSQEPQTPLSHVNLRAKQNDTPNAYLRDAATHPKVLPHLGSIVRYEVRADDLAIDPATAEEMRDFLDALRPAKVQLPPRDMTVDQVVDLDSAGHSDLPAIGAKAANVAELRTLLGDIVPRGHAIPFHFYDRFMAANGFYDEVRALAEDPAFRDDAEVRDRRLGALRKKIRRAKVPADLGDAIEALRAAYPADRPLRCRSSTNSEDLEGFNGAGLYDSYTHRPDEGRLENTVRKVWASLWNLRAFEERDFYRIDHFEAAMAVLVHPNFDNEIANGVALTKNVYFPDFEGFYINVQVGEALVTNPDPNAVPEELLVMRVDPESPYETIYIRRSSLTKGSAPVLTAPQVAELTAKLHRIQEHFRQVYRASSEAFAMDVEFKLDSEGRLVIKQARPWVD